MAEPQFRHEYKHALNWADYYTLRQRLRAIAKPDPNSGPNGQYFIRSLYFDNDDDKALKEKIYGLPNREKFRLRYYNHNPHLIRLEKKSKSSGLCVKESVPITRQQTQALLAHNITWMKESQNSLLTELYSKMSFQRLRPRTLVDYTREAYLYPYGNVRVTFDMNIRSGLYTTQFFAGNIPTIPVDEAGTLLLEIKYDQFLPDLMRDIIQTNTRKTQAFSKYASCRMFE